MLLAGAAGAEPELEKAGQALITVLVCGNLLDQRVTSEPISPKGLRARAPDRTRGHGVLGRLHNQIEFVSNIRIQ